MKPVEVEVVRRKLATIVEDLRALEPVRMMSKENYIEEFYKRKATERLLQELIEAAIDINVHLILEAGHAAPDDYYESFVKIGELGIISSDLAERVAPSAGLRNRLVHEYDMLDHEIVLKSVATAEELFSIYVKEINEYLSKA